MAAMGHVDPMFEFEAPRYIDFATGVENETEDVWFDAQKSSAEDLKTADLLESNSNEDFGMSIETTNFHQPTKKRSEETAVFDHRPTKKHRAQHYPVHTIPLTVPESPCFTTNSRLRGVTVESEEDFQCRYMASMLVEQARRRRFNSMYKKKALYGSKGYDTVRSTKPLTEPKEIHFHTDARLKGIPIVEEHKHQPVIEKNENGLTVPRPFQFYTNKVKPDFTELPRTSPFKSFKEKMLEIQKKTPKRFRTLPRNKLWQQRSPPSPYKLGITVPHEFSFETMERSRPIHVMSTEEREQLEMQNMPQFKALPLNQRVLHSDGQFGLTKLPKVPLTEPVTPHFVTDKRAKRPSHMEEEEPITMFKARDFDPDIFRGPVKGLPNLPPKEPTIPESPCLATKSRSIFHPPPAVPKEEPFVFKARPIPIFEPFVPEKQEHKLEVEPFQLQTEARGQKATKRMSEQMRKQKKTEIEKRNFKAQPMPITDRPEPQGFAFAPPITNPQPFVLLSDIRGGQHVQNFQQQKQAEEQGRKEMALFKAHPVHVGAPFQVIKGLKPLTEVSHFELNSDARAVQRQKFENDKSEKAKAAEEVRKLQEEEQRIQEEKQIKQMRKQMVHKPMPILPVKPVEVKKSSVPLTEAHTPLLRTRQRSALHSGRDL